MLNGVYSHPTVIFFGRGMDAVAGTETAKRAQKVLLHYGSESCRRHGLYGRVIASLKDAGVSVVDLGGVQSNPRFGLVRQGIELCRREGVGFVLAVGGGSVIDSAKAIAVGVPWDGDVMDFWEGRQVPQQALGVGTILTCPGSGSESNGVAVVTDEAGARKLALTSPLMIPAFSILNPELTITLSGFQTACGIADAMTHVLERYFTRTPYVDCTDRICEGLLATLMTYGQLVRDNPEDVDARGEIMWACKLAHDNTAGFGRRQDWTSHAIAHVLGAIYDLPHAPTVAAVILSWMPLVSEGDDGRFAQLAERVFPETDPNFSPVQRVVTGLRCFWQAMGLPTALRDIGIPDRSRFGEIADRCVLGVPSGTLGNFRRLGPEEIARLLEDAFGREQTELPRDFS